MSWRYSELSFCNNAPPLVGEEVIGPPPQAASEGVPVTAVPIAVV
jgi:hypothetical protein